MKFLSKKSSLQVRLVKLKGGRVPDPVIAKEADERVPDPAIAEEASESGSDIFYCCKVRLVHVQTVISVFSFLKMLSP